MKDKSSCLIFILTFSVASLSAENLTDYLIPVPKSIEQQEGSFNRNSGRIIIPELLDNSAVLRIAGAMQTLLSQLKIETTIAAKASEGEAPLVWIYLTPALPSQAYRITVNRSRILLEGGDEVGLFYALQTFKQIIRFAKDQGSIPLMSVEDKPDYKRRGVMIDVTRPKVPTMSTLRNLIDLFASWKINELQLYTENTFAYQNHKVVWEGLSPLTAEEILELDQYCRERFIDLVPNQTSFGHMDQWLVHDQYKDLAELEGSNSGTVISPSVPGSIALMRELYAELLPNFSSRYFNINCDETEELGTGRSKKLVAEKGFDRVYLDFILQLKNEVDKYGRTAMFWGDIILHYPELISELPKDMIALVWGYSDNYPYDRNCKKFHDAGCPFYVCPGTSAWNSLVGRNRNAFANLKNAAMNGQKQGALGFLNTDWGDNGHRNPLPVSYPALLYGAAVGWGSEANQQIDVGKLVSRYVFNDPTGKSGQALINIGNVYPDKTDVNSSLFSRILKNPGLSAISVQTQDQPSRVEQITAEDLQAAMVKLDQNLQILVNSPIASDDAKTIKDEMTLAVNLAKLACKIGLARINVPDKDLKKVPASKKKVLITEFNKLIEEHKRLWIIRNRPGGLQVSVGNFEKSLMELQQ